MNFYQRKMGKSLLNTTGITWQVEEDLEGLSDRLAFVATLWPKIHALDLKCTLNYIKERPKYLRAMLKQALNKRLPFAESAAAMGRNLSFKVRLKYRYHASQCNFKHDLVLEKRQDKLQYDEQAAKSAREFRNNLSILLLLSVMYGMILGIMAAIPMLLFHYAVTYKQQVKFSLAYWPYALKVLWAPFINSFATRWICPRNRKYFLGVMQVVIGMLMLRITGMLNKCLNCVEDLPTIADRYASFIFLLCLMAAALDVFGDVRIQQCHGSKLAKCGKILGIVSGFGVGYAVLLLLGFKMFLRRASLNWLCIIGVWGPAVCAVTLLIDCYKKQMQLKQDMPDRPQRDTAMVPSHVEPTAQAHETVLTLLESYRVMLQTMHRSNIAQKTVTMRTVRTSLYGLEMMSTLKLLRFVVFDDQLILFKLCLQPLHLSIPLCSRLFIATDTEESVYSYLKAIPYRISYATIIAAIVYYLPNFLRPTHMTSNCFYTMFLKNFVFYQLFMDCMYVLAGVMASNLMSELPCDGFYRMLRRLLDTNSCNADYKPGWLAALLQFLGFDPCTTYRTCIDCNIFNLTKNSGGIFSRSGFIGHYYTEFITCLGFALIWFYFLRSPRGSMTMRS